MHPPDTTPGQRQRVLWLSTTAFTLLFAVWLMLGMLSVRIKPDLGLTDAQLYNLAIAAILAGSLGRFHAGVWADRYGGRTVMTVLLLMTVVPTFLVSQVSSYTELLLCAALFGLSGNSFAVGIAWTAAWFPKDRQGLALGVFGAGNVGASVTKLFGPAIIAAVPTAGFLGGVIPGGWRFVPVVYSVLLVLMAAAVWFLSPAPDRCPGRGKTFADVVAPARHAAVWEFGLQYLVVFGAYVALSTVLPKYFLDNYGSELATKLALTPELVSDFARINSLSGEAYTSYMAAHPQVKTDLDSLIKCVGLLAAVCYVFPASLLRPLGGWLSDRYGARCVMAVVFAAMLASGLVLSVPRLGLGVVGFTSALFVLGAGMGIGKAGTYKLIPDRFPDAVGPVGGLVGLLGAVGGVVLPLAWGPLRSQFGVPQVVFAALLALTVVSAGWFYVGWLLNGHRSAQSTAVPGQALPGSGLAAATAT